MAGVPIKIPAELFATAESSRFEGEYDLPQLPIGPDDYAFALPVAWEVEVTNTGSALLVAGSARASGTCACSRCLEEAAYDFDASIEGFFLVEDGPAPALEGEEDDEPGEDEFDVLPADHIIDLAPLIEAALMVDAPQMPLCREDCAGLCATCGANLNEGPCGCAPDEALADFERAANPFSVLEGLTFD